MPCRERHHKGLTRLRGPDTLGCRDFRLHVETPQTVGMPWSRVPLHTTEGRPSATVGPRCGTWSQAETLSSSRRLRVLLASSGMPGPIVVVIVALVM